MSFPGLAATTGKKDPNLENCHDKMAWVREWS